MILAAAVCGPGDRLPCGTQQRIRLEPPLGQPPVLTNILINTILIMSLISLKPCTIISLMSSPTTRHTRSSGAQLITSLSYEPRSHPKPHYRGHKMTCGAYPDIQNQLRCEVPALTGGIAARPSLPCQVVSGGHSAGYSSWSRWWHQVTQHSSISMTSPPPAPSLTSSQILLSLQFIFRSLETLYAIRTKSAIFPPMCRLTRILVRILIARCTSFAVCRIGTNPLGKENSPSWPSLDIR